MEDFLRIKARLPRPAGLSSIWATRRRGDESAASAGPGLKSPANLELCARLLAERPYWDIEIDDDGLSFVIPLVPGRVDEELPVLEEACRGLERLRSGLESELDVSRSQARPTFPTPPALGPWRLLQADPGEELPSSGDSTGSSGRLLILPPTFSFSHRQWAGEALLLTALADHLSPPPGAPETRGKPALIMESIPPLTPLAALQAGAGPISLITDEPSLSLWADPLAFNRQDKAETVECLTLPFKSLSRRRDDWLGRFGLIAVYLSPYLSSSRLKSLAGWLHPEGAIIISGFAPGPQTAQIMRSAARAGLELVDSVNDGDWAAMKLRLTPAREELPPLTGTVVPDLVDLPPEEESGPEPENGRDQEIAADLEDGGEETVPDE